MIDKRLLLKLSVPLVAIGFCTGAMAQEGEQICIRVDGPMFSVSYHDVSESEDPLGGWICKRSADPDAPPTNIIGMTGFLLDVGFLKDSIQGGETCFVDQRCVGDPPYTVCDYFDALDSHSDDHSDVMTGTIQIQNKKNKPVEMVHWERGLTSVQEEILYMVQYVGEIDRDGALPPTYEGGATNVTTISFNTVLVETEGRGRLGKTACKGEFTATGTVEVARCTEQNPNPDETNGYIDESEDLVRRPLPCPDPVSFP